MPEIPFTKGHGTGNDFVIVPDPDGVLDLSAAQVAALCDRHFGIGADGLLRVVRSAAGGFDSDAEWFMDYRNADGSLAEMCGNGARVFVAYLRDLGHVTLADGDEVRIGTRGGVRRVRAVGEDYAVAMGEFALPGGERALTEGTDVVVDVPGLAGSRGGLRVEMPNPHTVLALPDLADLDSARLELGTVAYAPEPPEGTNLELVVPGTEQEIGGTRVGTLTMRVLERGVGETRSCGTGCCAAAVAVRAWAGAGAPDAWLVTVPGGQVRVDVAADRQVTLTGPAVLVADVTIR